MTKKSLARQERDAAAAQEIKQTAEAEIAFNQEKNTNKAWDELKTLNQHIHSQIITANEQVVDLFKVPQLHGFLQNPTNTASVIRCLAADVRNILEQVTGLLKLHEDKCGGWSTTEEYFQTIEIYEQYVSIQNLFEGVLMPSITQLTEDFAFAIRQAEECIKDSEPKPDELTDPTVISDAIIKG